MSLFKSCSIRFFDGESSSRTGRGDTWKPRDSFKPDTPPNWLNIPAGGTANDLRVAIVEFVERHQWQKLYKHVRRGNLNGLPNFLDIFRTLNGLLITYHSRNWAGTGPLIPFGFVTTGIMTNLELLIGPFEPSEDVLYEGNGFIAAIQENMPGDLPVIRERLRDERVPQILRAAAEAMIEARRHSRRMTALDPWAMKRLRWISLWVKAQGLDQPTAEDVRLAGLEYLPEQRAA